MAAVERAVPTGLYWPCNMNGLLQELSIALPVKRGPKVFFTKCIQCGTTHHFGATYKDGMGMSRRQAEEQNFFIAC